MRLNFSVPVIALLAGTAIGFCLRTDPSSTPAAEEPSDATGRAPSHIADANADGSVEALRSRIKELEALLANAAKESAEKAKAVAESEADGPRSERRERFNPREMMERLKSEDPERYTQMTNRMARFRQFRTEQALSKLDFLAAIDLSPMGSEAQATHSRLQSIIARREEIEEKLHSETISDEERESVMQEMFATDREMMDLNNQERSNLIAEVVSELGFSGDDADDIVATIKDIIDATSSNFGPPGGGPGGPRGGRGPGPRNEE